MKEVAQTELFKLRGIFDTVIKEMQVRITAPEAIVNFDRAYTGKYLKCFTDDIEDPKHLLILSYHPGLTLSGFVCMVNVIYSHPQHRTQEVSREMFSVIDSFAKENRCEQIIGAARKFRGTRGIDCVWLKNGYEIQETVYVKML